MPRFWLSRLFSDHAVLCRDKEIRVFGRAEEKITLTAELKTADGTPLACDRAETDAGDFLLLLPPQSARTGCMLTVSDGMDTVTCRDIAIGDVYLANGQSNMELELQNADEGRALVKTHQNDLVRYFNVPKFAREGEDAEAANRAACWRSIAPGVGADMSAAAYFFAMKLQPALGVPVGIIDCYWGGTSVTCWMDDETLNATAEGRRYKREYAESCRGKTMEQYLREEADYLAEAEAWGKRAGEIQEKNSAVTPQQLKELLGPFPWPPPAGPGAPYRPGGLFAAMLRRVIPMTLTGVLYYQGEEDTWRTERYDILLTSYILRLRELFRDADLPFLNVQLPMWIDAGAEDSGNWPRLRMAQYKVYRNVRNTGLVILIDEGEYDNIHPTNKRVVGERLCLEALDVVYHQPAEKAVFACGHERRENELLIHLTGTITDTGKGEYRLEIAGADGPFLPANVRLLDDTLALSHPDIPRPVRARYAWTDYAILRLRGENGLPLAPFVIG